MFRGRRGYDFGTAGGATGYRETLKDRTPLPGRFQRNNRRMYLRLLSEIRV